MSNFVSLKEVKKNAAAQGKLSAEDLKKVKGGYTLMYGVIDPFKLLPF
jgi:hypothetical protein